MAKIKLYQELSEKQMEKFLKENGSSIAKQALVEIIDKENDLVGDFIVIAGYKFKKVYGQYNCMETPTEKHQKAKCNWPKAPNDHYRRK